MGVTHATSGAAAWIAATAVIPPMAVWIVPFSPSGVLAGAVVSAGAALLPDVDHHSATVARSVPILGRIIAGAAGTLGGGHRQGFHSLVAVVAIWLLSVGPGTLTGEVPGLGTVALGPAVAAAALCCFAVKARGLVQNWSRAWLVGLSFGVLVLVLAPAGPVWFPLAVTLGYAAHLLGDLLTTGGIPLVWPLRIRRPRRIGRGSPLAAVWRPNGSFALPVLGDTGSVREWILGLLLAAYVGCGVVVELVRAIRPG